MQMVVSMHGRGMMSDRNWNQNVRESAHVGFPARSRIPRGYQSVEPVVQTASANGMRGEMMMWRKRMKREH